jgi:uncharacterized caspase-like protein
MAMPERQALAIGNDSYLVNRLPFCVNDATDLSSCLRMIGFRVQCATDLHIMSMKSITRQFVQSIRPGSIALFYFSGHGLQYNGENYLIPTDNDAIDLGNINESMLNIQELINDMMQKGPRLMLIILDCCRAYEVSDSTHKRGFFDRASSRNKQGLAPMRAPSSTITAFACAADEYSSGQSRNGRNSVYTYHLLRHIRTPNVDIDLILRNVAVDVARETKNKQTPFRYSSCNEIICLVNNWGVNVPAVPMNMQPIPVSRKSFLRNSIYLHCQPAFRISQESIQKSTRSYSCSFSATDQPVTTSIERTEYSLRSQSEGIIKRDENSLTA